MRNFLRQNAVALSLVGAHSACVLLAWRSVVESPGLLSGFHWLPVAAIDFPLTVFGNVFFDDALSSPVATGLTYLIGGGIYWILIGAAVQTGLRRFLRRLESA